MYNYSAPLSDIQFAYRDVLQLGDKFRQLTGNDEASDDLIEAVLQEAAKFAEGIIAPLHRSGDEQGCKLVDGQVITPDGFKEAYQQFVDNGWGSLAQDPERGGQGLPLSVQMAFYEMVISANIAWGLYPTTTWGAITTLEAHATPELQDLYIPDMVSGNWTGTMCLTEPHCGSDLGLLRTKAEPNDDGSYNITGTKIFITTGDQDCSENIVHICLARIPGAPEGTRGISLFIVPKYGLDENGRPAERNNVNTGNIEEKMGLHGNPTCVLNFDGAKGWLVGEENRGLNYMFTFINESRIDVCLQAQGQIERSFQGALAYAKERLQMKATPRFSPDKPADPIIAHPEIRRLLLTQQALSEGSRLIAYDLAGLADTLRGSNDPAQQAQAQAALSFLTPIGKGFITEMANETTNLGIQVLGGHGFIQESGMEQMVRDVRIASIYEGTTAIQGLDLIGRKIIADDRRQMNLFVDQMRALCDESSAQFPDLSLQLGNAIDSWLSCSETVLVASANDPAEMNAVAVDYLMMSGYVITGYYLLRAALVAKTTETASDYADHFLANKEHLARFYMQKILPRIESLKLIIASGKTSIMATDYPMD